MLVIYHYSTLSVTVSPPANFDDVIDFNYLDNFNAYTDIPLVNDLYVSADVSYDIENFFLLSFVFQFFTSTSVL